jgi:hypothetical protein
VISSERLVKEEVWKVKRGGGVFILIFVKKDEINSKIACRQNNSVTFAAL